MPQCCHQHQLQSFISSDLGNVCSAMWGSKLHHHIPSHRQHKWEEEVLAETKRELSALEYLPAEILHLIAQFLSAKDLLACTAACSRLRSVFNDDIIWRRFCKNNVTKYIKYSKPKVNTSYGVSYIRHNLDPLCDERISYMHQNQLLNNWKNGRFVEHKVYSSTGLYYMCLKSGTPIIYENIYLFLYDFYGHRIVVWNIEDIPFRHTSVRLLYHNYFYEGLHYEIAGNKLIIVEVGKLIQMYGINLPDKTLPLVHIILFDQCEPMHKIPEFSTPEEMYTVCYHKIIERKIYSHKVGKPVIHIWDAQTGKKVVALEPPKAGNDFDVLSAARNGNDLTLCLEINDPQRQYNALGTVYEVMTYSFSRNFFRTFWTNAIGSSTTYVPFHAVQYRELIVLFCRLHNYFIEDPSLPKTVIVLYDSKWGVIIGEKTFPELVCHKQSKVVKNQLLLATAFCVYLVDLLTLDTVLSFKFDCGKIELLNVFDGSFIVTTPRSLISVSKTKRKEVWDIKNRLKCLHLTYVFTSPYTKDSVFVNQSFTKLIVVGKGTLGVLNFW